MALNTEKRLAVSATAAEKLRKLTFALSVQSGTRVTMSAALETAVDIALTEMGEK